MTIITVTASSVSPRRAADHEAHKSWKVRVPRTVRAEEEARSGVEVTP
jgi:hypothetical protein